MENAARQLFRKHFGSVPTHAVHASGTLELLGSHAEANQGLAVLAAFDRGVGMAVSPRADGRVELVMAGQIRPEQFWLNRLEPGAQSLWTAPVKAMLAGLRRKGVAFSGFSGAIVNAVPPGLGAGELEALLLATALAVRQLAPFTLTDLGLGEPPRRDARGRLAALGGRERLLLARLCAESAARANVPGIAPSRLVAALTTKAWHACCIDCKLGTVDRAALVGEVLVLCDSGVRAADGRGVAALKAEWSEATKALQARSLRSVELAYLRANRKRLTERQYACVYHAVGEVQRVVHGEKALQQDDHRQFGHFMFASHESAAEHLGNSVAEADLLVNLARREPGCLGARLMGDGFGGATVNLVAFHQVAGFIERMAEAYESETGRPLRPLVCQVVDA